MANIKKALQKDILKSLKNRDQWAYGTDIKHGFFQPKSLVMAAHESGLMLTVSRGGIPLCRTYTMKIQKSKEGFIPAVDTYFGGFFAKKVWKRIVKVIRYHKKIQKGADKQEAVRGEREAMEALARGLGL